MTEQRSNPSGGRSAFRSVTIIVITAIVLYGTVFKFISHPEPVYRGRTLSSWFEQLKILEFDDDIRNKTDPALMVIRAMGPETVPFLQKMAEAQEPIAGRLRRSFGDRPVSLLFGNRSRDSGYEEHEKAIWCLGELGPAARPALTSITNSYVWQSKAHIFEAWSKIEPANSRPVTELCKLMKSTHQTDRFFAALALRNCDPSNPEVLKTLSAGLVDTDREVRANCALSLGQFGAAARTTIPGLQLAAMDTSYGRVQINAARALCRIDFSQCEFAAKAAGRSLKANDPWGALGFLTEIGPAARAALPELEKFLPPARGLRRQRDELVARLQSMSPPVSSGSVAEPENPKNSSETSK
jgi:hypothetical protein